MITIVFIACSVIIALVLTLKVGYDWGCDDAMEHYGFEDVIIELPTITIYLNDEKENQ